jgi:RES domain-containing protein
LITAWRIVKKKYQTAVLSGEGARLGGGRWNYPGVPVVYGSETLSLAALELFVHFVRKDIVIGKALVAIPITVPDNVGVTDVLTADLKTGWDSSPPSDSTRDIGTKWIRDGLSAVLRVPSAIIPEEHNYVMNPGHADFAKITAGPPRPFSLDARMWKS